jgi:hypothetical protein
MLNLLVFVVRSRFLTRTILTRLRLHLLNRTQLCRTTCNVETKCVSISTTAAAAATTAAAATSTTRSKHDNGDHDGPTTAATTTTTTTTRLDDGALCTADGQCHSFMEGGAAGTLGCRTRCCSAVTNVTASPCPGCDTAGQCYRGLRLTDSGSESVSSGVVRWPIQIDGTGLGVSCGAGATAAAFFFPAAAAPPPTSPLFNNNDGLYAGPGSDFADLGFHSWQQEQDVAVPKIGEAEDSGRHVTEPAEIRCV